MEATPTPITPIVLEYTVNRTEHVDACRTMCWRAPAMYGVLLAFSLLAIGFVLWDLRLNPAVRAASTLRVVVDLLGALGFIGTLAAMLWWVTPRRVASRFMGHGFSYPIRQRLSFEPTGVKMSAGSVESSVGWDHVREIVETRRFWLVYLSRGMAFFIPKKQIPEATAAVLRAALTGWLGNRAKLRAA
ncbi:MAG: YcxB family protein [Chloroflexota bacterium]